MFSLLVNSFSFRWFFPCQPFETDKIIGALVFFSLGWLFIMFARKGTRVFIHWHKEKDKKYSSIAFAILFFTLGLLLLMSAMFGWGC